MHARCSIAARTGTYAGRRYSVPLNRLTGCLRPPNGWTRPCLYRAPAPLPGRVVKRPVICFGYTRISEAVTRLEGSGSGSDGAPDGSGSGGVEVLVVGAAAPLLATDSQEWKNLETLLKDKQPSYVVLEGAPGSAPAPDAAAAGSPPPSKEPADRRQRRPLEEQQEQLRRLASSAGARVVLAPSPDSASLLQQLVAQGRLDSEQVGAAAAAAAAGLEDLEALLLEGARASRAAAEQASGAGGGLSAADLAAPGAAWPAAPSLGSFLRSFFGLGAAAPPAAAPEGKDLPDLSLRPSVGAPGAAEERMRRCAAWRRGLAVASLLRWLDANGISWKFVDGGGAISLGSTDSDDDDSSSSDEEEDTRRHPPMGPPAGVGGRGDGGGGDEPGNPWESDRVRALLDALRGAGLNGGGADKPGDGGGGGGGSGGDGGGDPARGGGGPGGAAPGSPPSGGGLLSKGEFDLVLEIGTGDQRRLMRIRVDRDMRTYSSGADQGPSAAAGPGAAGPAQGAGAAAGPAAPGTPSGGGGKGGGGGVGGGGAAAAGPAEGPGPDGGYDVPSSRGRRGLGRGGRTGRGPRRGARGSGAGGGSGGAGSGGVQGEISKELSGLAKGLEDEAGIVDGMQLDGSVAAAGDGQQQPPLADPSTSGRNEGSGGSAEDLPPLLPRPKFPGSPGRAGSPASSGASRDDDGPAAARGAASGEAGSSHPGSTQAGSSARGSDNAEQGQGQAGSGSSSSGGGSSSSSSRKEGSEPSGFGSPLGEGAGGVDERVRERSDLLQQRMQLTRAYLSASAAGSGKGRDSPDSAGAGGGGGASGGGSGGSDASGGGALASARGGESPGGGGDVPEPSAVFSGEPSPSQAGAAEPGSAAAEAAAAGAAAEGAGSVAAGPPQLPAGLRGSLQGPAAAGQLKGLINGDEEDDSEAQAWANGDSSGDDVDADADDDDDEQQAGDDDGGGGGDGKEESDEDAGDDITLDEQAQLELIARQYILDQRLRALERAQSVRLSKMSLEETMLLMMGLSRLQQGLEPSEDEAALLSRLLVEADLIPRGAPERALRRRREMVQSSAEDFSDGDDDDEDDEEEDGDEFAGMGSRWQPRDTAVRPDLSLIRWPGQQPKTRRERRALKLRRARLQRRGAAAAGQAGGGGAVGGGGVTMQENSEGGLDVTLNSWEQLLGSFRTQLPDMQQSTADGGTRGGSSEGPAAAADSAAAAESGSSGVDGDGGERGGPAPLKDSGALVGASPSADSFPPAYRLLLEQRSRAVVQQLRAVLPQAQGAARGADGGGGGGRGAVVAVVPLALLPFVESEWVRATGEGAGKA